MLLREINSLSCKEKFNIYLKVTIENKVTYSKFHFLSLNSLSPGQFLGAPAVTDMIEFINFLLQLKCQSSGSKTVAFLFYVFNFLIKEL